jgi:hypothetical protein
MPRPALILLATLLAALAWPAAGRAAPRWRAPVDGRLVARFTYARAHPFAAGQRRGAAFSAARGSPVVAPCGGRIAFSGRVPRFGAVIGIRCRDGLVATLLELAGAAVRRGARVEPGQRLGAVGSGGRLRLGARHASDRFGYRDPLPLLVPADRPPLPGLPLRPALGPAPRGGPAPRAPRPVWVPSASPARSAAPRSAPLAAWLGAALMATALGAGGTARLACRRRAARTPVAALSRAPGGG